MKSEINYMYINSFIRNTLQLRNQLLMDLEVIAKDRNIPIIQPEINYFLEILCMMKKPKKILEIGTAIGYSTLVFAQATLADTIIDTIDISLEMINEAKENLQKANLNDKVNFLHGDAFDVLQCLNKKYDLIFLDAAKGQYSTYLPECLRLLHDDGVLISDNVLYKGLSAKIEKVEHKHRTIAVNMKNYLIDLCNKCGYKTTILQAGDGVAITIKVPRDIS